MPGILSHAASVLLNRRSSVLSYSCLRCCCVCTGWRCPGGCKALTQLLCSTKIALAPVLTWHVLFWGRSSAPA